METENSPVSENDGQRPVAPGSNGAGQAANGSDTPPDLVTIASLIPWMEDGMERIGQERMTAIVELYGSIGGLPDDLSDVMHRLIALGASPGNANEVTLRECLYLMVELDALVSRVKYDRPGAALLSMFIDRRGAEPPLTREGA